MDWSGLTCVVVGASSGIGRAAAVAAAGRGATVLAVARREDRLIELVSELGGEPHSYVVCDVSDLEQVRSMAAAVAARTTKLDVLINSAGIPGHGPINRTTPEQAEALIKVNLVSAIWCIQLLFPLMGHAPRDGRTPVVVNVASMAGRIPLPGAALYTASKFGLVGFTEALWGEMQSLGIQTMAVNPGFVHTEGFPMDHLLGTPLLRWTVMSPERVGEAICKGVENRRTEVKVQGWWNAVYLGTVLLGPLRRRMSRSVWKSTGGRRKARL
ncbi:MAG TPA: SDR family NAD(P)-dependent oxidoreductase [Actinomycetota bacterium]|nr:SDR family NAD(P)-dependent oxidoreductase [Actinomycetota bacterium]